MATGKVNSIADIPALEKEKEEIIAFIQEIIAEFKRMNATLKGTELSIQGGESFSKISIGVKEATKTLEGMATKTREASAAYDMLSVAKQKLAALNSPEAKQLAEITVAIREKQKALLDEAKATNPVIAARQKAIEVAKQEAAALAEATAIREKDAEATRVHAMVTAQDGEAMLKGADDSLAYADAQSGLAASQKESAAEARQAAASQKELSSAEQKTANTTDQHTASIDQNKTALQGASLRLVEMKNELAYVNSEIKAANASLEAGTVAYEAYEERVIDLTTRQIQLRGEIIAQTTAVKELAGVTEAAGSKMSKFESIIQRMGLRMIASLVIFQGIIELFKGVKEEVDKSADAINFKQETLIGIAEKSNNAFSQEASTLQALKARFEDVATSMDAKKEIVDELNLKYENQIGKISGVNDAEKFFRDKTPEMIEALKLRAEAEGALAVIRENSQKQVEALANPEKELTGIRKIAIGLKSAGEALTTFNDKNIVEKFKENFDWNSIVQGSEAANQAMTQYGKNIAFATNQFIQLSNQATAIDTANGFHTDVKGKKLPAEKKAPDASAAEIKGLKDLNEALAFADKQKVEQESTTQKEIVDNVKQSIAARLDANKQYYSALAGIAAIENNKSIDNEQDTLDVLLKKDAEAKAGKIKLTKDQQKAVEYEIEASQVRLAALKENLTTVFKQLDAKQAKDEVAIAKSSTEEQIKVAKEGYNKIIEASTQAENEKLTLLDNKYHDGLLTEKEYHKQRKKIQLDSENSLYTLEHDYLVKTIEDLKTMPGVTQEVVDAINKILGTLKKPQTNNGQTLFGYTEDDIKKAEFYANSSIKILSSINSYEETLSQQRLKRIDDEIAASERRRDSEIRFAELTMAAGAAKDDAEKRILGEADQRRVVLEEKKKREEIAAAERNKRLKIADIIITGAASVVEAFFHNGGFAGALAAGAIVASELAVAIATPAYEHGTPAGGHIGGMARIGEKGKPELVIEPGKAPRVVTKESVEWLEPKAQVIPLSNIMQNPAAMQAANNDNSDKLIAGYGNSTNRVVRELREIKNKKQVVIINNGRQNDWEYKNARA